MSSSVQWYLRQRRLRAAEDYCRRMMMVFAGFYLLLTVLREVSR